MDGQETAGLRPVRYLGLQKTGSTFVRDFLSRNVRGGVGDHRKHQRPDADLPPETFYIISVRDPAATYLSLYRYGCGGGGGAARRLRSAGLGHLYAGTQAGFEAWLALVLDPARSELGGRGYARANPALVGPLTWRFLRLALPGARRRLARCTGRDDVRAQWAGHGLPLRYLRTETLAADLAALVRTDLRPFLVDPAAAEAELAAARPANVSAPVAEPLAVTGPLRARIVAREWFYAELLGYCV
jgi:hypothetical protein